ncbi:MAG: ligand-binding sensor domain-containing protein, partial [Litorivivens sp.]
ALGQIWIGTDDGGLWRFDPTLKEFYFATPQFAEQAIFAIASGKDGELWAATRSGLFELSSDGGLTPAFSGQKAGDRLTGLHIRAVLQEPDGTLWVGTQTEGAFRIAADGSFEHFVAGEAESESISGMQVVRFLLDDRGDVWLATIGGLDHFTESGFVSHHYDPANPRSLSTELLVQKRVSSRTCDCQSAFSELTEFIGGNCSLCKF